MSNETRVKVTASQFESLGKKLEEFHSKLPAGEVDIFEFFMENLASSAGQSPPPSWITPHFHYKPRGGKMLVVGGVDGLTILVNSHGKITVVGPIGPLPMDRHTDTLGAIPIMGLGE